MELSATGRVILGMLGVGPHSGYDIKAMADKSARFFWAASYGQIYPELKKLSEQGLVEGSDESQGGRKRTVYRITEAGKAAVEEWLMQPEQTHELRDEGLLKVFFGSTVGDDHVVAAIREKREAHARALAEMEVIEPFAAQAGRLGPAEALEYGLGYSRFAIEWCDRILKRIEEEK